MLKKISLILVVVLSHNAIAQLNSRDLEHTGLLI